MEGHSDVVTPANLKVNRIPVNKPRTAHQVKRNSCPRKEKEESEKRNIITLTR